MKDLRIVALEEHMLTPAFVEAAGQGRGAPAAEYFDRMRNLLLEIGRGRLASMDEAGVDVQVLSLAGAGLDKLDAPSATALVRDVNDAIADAVRRHPDRFAGFAAVALQDPGGAAQELKRAIGKLGFRGVMIHGTVDGAFMDDPRFTPFWEAAQELQVPVYLHPAPPPASVREAYYSGLPGDVGYMLSTAAWGWHVETGMHVLRLIVSGLFDRLPGLKLIIGHMGENLPFSLTRADAVLSRSSVKLERRVADYFHEHFWVTISGYFSVPPLLCALQVVGSDRLLFSVDYPFSSNRTAVEFLMSAPLSPADRIRLAHQNADTLLGLSPKKITGEALIK
jgi:predicted TIM-barrel fold metal-dependent hydrolase